MPSVGLYAVAELLASGADPNVAWFKITFHRDDTEIVTRGHPLVDELMALNRREPRRLLTLCAAVVRQCLAAAEFNGVMKNTDRLPLPSTVKSLLKLDMFDFDI